MAYFLRRTGKRSEAEDLTQETFVRLIASSSFGSAEKTDAYVFRVATNLLRDRARSAARWKEVSAVASDADTIDVLAHEVAEDRGPERVLIGREHLAEVLDCLDALGERTKS